MTGKKKTLFIEAPLMAALALAAGVVLIAGSASAKYQADGAAPNGTTGGWNAPTDGICVLGLHADGTMDVDTSITTARDCQARLIDVTAVTSNDTLANVCGNATKNTAGVKYAAPGSSTCVTVDGSGYINGSLSMVNLDRNATMCTAVGTANSKTTYLANNTTLPVKTTANGTAAKCISYGWQYRFQDASGTPLTFGSTGVTPAASGTGFCYTSVRTGIAAASCPSTLTGTDLATVNAKYGYSVASGNCLYAYGTSGVANAALAKIDGTSYKAAGDAVDLQALTQGQCLANGASWANGWGSITTGNTYSTTDGWTSGTGVKFDQSRQALNSDEGCLHCHSYTSQQNGPAERFKDSYLKTGHKNMLRKVTAGSQWAGPNSGGVITPYTTWGAGGANTINWAAGTTTIGANTYPLLYIFGDWMAPAPDGLDVIVNVSGSAKYNGTSNYSCAACHTTGWNNTDSAAGLCNYSSKTTQAACVAVTSGTFGAGVWYPLSGVQAIGIPGYSGTQPADSFSGVTFTGAGQWDLDGITCGRCHNATVPAVSQTQINASIYTTTYPTAAGMGNIPGGPDGGGTYANFLCFSCHQSVAKTLNGTGADADLSHPEALPVKNNATAPAYVPGFSGHVIGGSFLNSVHGKATATIQPNSLGKYDIKTATYASTFKGYTCWQSSSSSSPAMTWVDATKTTQAACEAVDGEWSSGACIREIKDKTKCEGLYGAGAWRAATQGSCVTCHDVHKSLFVAGQEALRKECTSCHDNTDYAAAVPAAPQINLAVINHLKTAGTPLENWTSKPDEACEICHMPKPTSADFPMHVWRINPDAAYSTFPTALEFGIGGTATKKNANTAADGTYTNAVWVDVDLACGQCHGGSAGSGATKNGALYRDKATLAAVAKGMHSSAAVTYPVTFSSAVGTGANSLRVDVAGSVGCDTGCPTFAYDWDWGDGTAHDTTSGAVAHHTYAAKGSCSLGASYTTKLACEAAPDGHWSESYSWPITLTVTASGEVAGSATRNVRVYNPVLPPSASGTCTWNANTWTATVVDTSTAGAGAALMSTIVTWGDGAKSVAPAQPLNHTYIKAGGPYTVTLKVIDNALQASGPVTLTCSPAVQPATFTISGTVKNLAGTANVGSASVTVKKGTMAVAVKYTASDGTFSAVVKPGTYTLTVAKPGYTFASPAATITVGPSSTGNIINATAP